MWSWKDKFFQAISSSWYWLWKALAWDCSASPVISFDSSVHRKKLNCKPKQCSCKKYELLTKYEDTMTGHWPSYFFRVYGPRWGQSRNMRKKNETNIQKKEWGQYLAILTRQARSIKNLLHGKGSLFSCRYPITVQESVHLSHLWICSNIFKWIFADTYNNILPYKEQTLSILWSTRQARMI